MIATLVTLFFVAMGAVVAVGVFRAILRVWLDHRIKLSLLERLDSNPALLESCPDIRTLLESGAAPGASRPQQDYAWTGLFLIFSGVACIIFARILAVGTVAVGLYYGGGLCVWVGIVLGIVGLVIRSLKR